MSWFTNLWRGVRNWFRPRYRAQAMDDFPDSLRERTLYLIGEGQPWQAAMRCPCGCNAVIQLSLVPNDRPRWRATVDRQARPTLAPSVWRSTGCRAHFFLRNGRIFWC